MRNPQGALGRNGPVVRVGQGSESREVCQQWQRHAPVVLRALDWLIRAPDQLAGHPRTRLRGPVRPHEETNRRFLRYDVRENAPGQVEPSRKSCLLLRMGPAILLISALRVR